jgi:hypothetical protein
MAGQCPKCEKMVTSVDVDNVDIVRGGQTAWRGISYSCPWCHTVISVGIDPASLKSDTVNAITKMLRGRSA